MKAHELAAKLPCPNEGAIKSALLHWNVDTKEQTAEKYLVKLFTETYPKNTDFDKVMTKVCTLNSLYSTRLYNDVIAMSHNIINLNIDSVLEAGVVSSAFMEKLAKVEKRHYSFATKYCSFHKPDIYPIYDSYISLVLGAYNSRDRFTNISLEKAYRYYESFYQMIHEFIAHYKLDNFSIRDVDKFLWQAGDTVLNK